MGVKIHALENDDVRSLTSEKPNIAYLVVDVLYFHSPDLVSDDLKGEKRA